MKKYILLLSILFITVSCLLNACKKSDDIQYTTFYRPIFKSKTEVRLAIKSLPPREITVAGKIFIQGNYLFLVDVDRGVHVIDIRTISKPRKVSFIQIPGCNDIAVRGNYLYADCNTDLVTIDIGNPTNISLKKAIPNIFPQRNYYSSNYSFSYNSDTTKTLAGWIRVDTAVSKSTGTVLQNTTLPIFFANAASASATVTNGTGGSTSRFGLLNDRMYTVGYTYLNVFNTADAANPAFVKKSSLNQGNIETIFPYKNTLFIGSQNGMFIYDASNPDNPVKLSVFTHARVCDPVIADDHTAYVTLHSGTSCGGFTNQMDVLDINSLTNPILVKTYALTSPRGLAKDGNFLLICDGTNGLKIFNSKNANNIFLLKQVPNINAQDVITFKGFAIVTAAKGLYFVDYRYPANANIVNFIAVGN